MARKTKAQRKERRKKILTKVRRGGKLIMKVSMIATRGAFLSAVALNLFNLATRLRQLNEKNPDAIPKFWGNFGGEMKGLDKAIAKGLQRIRFKKAQKEKKKKGKVGENNENGYLGEYTAAAVVAIALPIVTAAIKLFTSNKSDKKGDADNDAGNVKALQDALIKNTPEQILNSKVEEEKGGGIMNNKPLLIGGVAAALIGGYFLLKKK
jgi:hypothetical protein